MALSKGLLKRSALAITLALVVFLALLSLLPLFLKPILNKWLPVFLGTPTSTAEVTINSVSWRKTHIDKLYIPLTDNSFVDINNLIISYGFDDLLAMRINSIYIGSLNINITDKKTQAIRLSAADDLEKIAKDNFNKTVVIPQVYQWLELPFSELKIDQLHVDHPSANGKLTAHITPENWRIQGDLKLQAVDTAWNLEMHANKSKEGFTWLLMIYEQQVLLTQLYGLAIQDNEHTTAQLRLSANLQELSLHIPELNDLSLPFDALVVNADIKVPNKGVLPRDTILHGSASLTSIKKKLNQQIGWQQGSWDLKINKPELGSDWLIMLTSTPQILTLNKEVLGNKADASLQQDMTIVCDNSASSCAGNITAQKRLFDSQKNEVASLLTTPTFQWQYEKDASFELTVEGSVNHPQFFIDEPLLKKASIKGKLVAQLLADNEWSANSTEGIKAIIEFNQHDGWEIPNAKFTLLQAVNVSGNVSANKLRDILQSDPVIVALEPMLIRKDVKRPNKTTLSIAESQLSCRPIIGTELLNLMCNMQLHSNKSYWHGWPIPDIDIEGPLNLRNITTHPIFTANLELKAAQDNIVLRLNAQHNVTQQKGSLQWHLADIPMNWTQLDLDEMQLLTQTQLIDGSISGQGWVDWQWREKWEFTPDVSLRADNVNAIYDYTMMFDKWTALISLRRPSSKDYLLDAQTSGASFNMGIPLTNILARSQTRIGHDFSWAEFSVHDLYADIFGGSISAPAFRYDTRQKTNNLSVKVNNIQLAQIVEVETEVGIDATGSLDGNLPIVIENGKIHVPYASLYARAPGGIVQYGGETADALAATNISLGLAMNLLSNFHYDKLQTEISYKPDGLFNMDLKFQGKNPDFFKGKPTHFNANLEYNLLDLLESLRVTQDLMSWPETLLDP